jgi:hypothetical protein
MGRVGRSPGIKVKTMLCFNQPIHASRWCLRASITPTWLRTWAHLLSVGNGTQPASLRLQIICSHTVPHPPSALFAQQRSATRYGRRLQCAGLCSSGWRRYGPAHRLMRSRGCSSLAALTAVLKRITRRDQCLTEFHSGLQMPISPARARFPVEIKIFCLRRTDPGGAQRKLCILLNKWGAETENCPALLNFFAFVQNRRVFCTNATTSALSAF